MWASVKYCWNPSSSMRPCSSNIECSGFEGPSGENSLLTQKLVQQSGVRGLLEVELDHCAQQVSLADKEAPSQPIGQKEEHVRCRISGVGVDLLQCGGGLDYAFPLHLDESSGRFAQREVNATAFLNLMLRLDDFGIVHGPTQRLEDRSHAAFADGRLVPGASMFRAQLGQDGE